MIRFAQVTYTPPGGQPLLEGLSFEVPRGGLTWLVGPSGAGKTTALRLAHGALRPSAGQIFIDERAVGSLRRAELPALRRQVAFLETRPRLLAGKSLLENVALPLRLAGEPEEVCLRRAQEVMADMGVAHKAHRRPHEVDPGALHRCNLARALAAAPSVLLADEPLALVDEALGEQLLGLLREAQLRGVTCLITDHRADRAHPQREAVVALPNPRVGGSE